MSTRKYPIVAGETYHVYNHSIGDHQILTKHNDTQRFLKLVEYYQHQNPQLRYSYYCDLNYEAKQLVDKRMISSPKLVKVFAYCLMPNHYHFVIREAVESGIVTFISLIQNSFAKYYNTLYQRVGSLFQARFKAKRIEDDEQLIHTTRYVHLNPYSSFLVKDIEGLKTYPLSSFPSYVGNANDNIVQKDEILDLFGGPEKLLASTIEQADYQRQLKLNETEMFN